jgi:hypothetical protein
LMRAGGELPESGIFTSPVAELLLKYSVSI